MEVKVIWKSISERCCNEYPINLMNDTRKSFLCRAHLLCRLRTHSTPPPEWVGGSVKKRIKPNDCDDGSELVK